MGAGKQSGTITAETPTHQAADSIQRTCRLLVESDSLDHLIIRLEINPKMPIPVAYDLIRMDSVAAVMHLYDELSQTSYPRRFEPPGRDFHLCVVYMEYPGDSAEFHIYKREENPWHAEPVHETGFVKLLGQDEEKDD